MEGVAHSTARSLCRAISREGALYIETEHANKCCVFEEPWRLKFMLEILLFSQVYSSRKFENLFSLYVFSEEGAKFRKT